MFTARKIAQMAAVFAKKQGGTIPVLKLMKLLYLSDREAMRRCGLPISYDRVVALPHGPVLSKTLSLIDGCINGQESAHWEEWISDRDNHNVSLQRDFSRDDLDQLSNADLEVIDSVWKEFGAMDKWTIRDYTHDHCPEWKDPNGSAHPIADKEILIALGMEDDEASALADDIEVQRSLDRDFARL